VLETAAASASTTTGSKSVPEQRRALRYERSLVIALNAWQALTIRATGGVIGRLITRTGEAGIPGLQKLRTGYWRIADYLRSGFCGSEFLCPTRENGRLTAVGGAAAIDDVYLDPMKSS
jgi:hypothetical protein